MIGPPVTLFAKAFHELSRELIMPPVSLLRSAEWFRTAVGIRFDVQVSGTGRYYVSCVAPSTYASDVPLRLQVNHVDYPQACRMLAAALCHELWRLRKLAFV